MSASSRLTEKGFATYYRVSCVDGQAPSCIAPEPGAAAVSLSNRYLLENEGKIPQKELNFLKKHLNKDKRDSAFQVLIQTRSYVQTTPRAYQSKVDYPLEICAVAAVATVREDGSLYFPYGSEHPQIPRELQGTGEGLLLVSTDEADKYLATHASDVKDELSWSKFDSIVTAMAHDLIDQKAQSFGYSLNDTVYVTITDASFDATAVVVSAYHRLERKKESVNLPLFNSLIYQAASNEQAPSFVRTIGKRYGQMGDAFPLADAQRNAVGATMLLNDGDIQALNGPPGTGKTTMLQSVVASLFTKAAVNKEPAPIIFGSSTNNQAITNIVESFNSAVSNSADGSYAQKRCTNIKSRWILSEGQNISFGLYFASSSKEKSTPYLTPRKFEQGLYGNSLEAAKEHFTNLAKEGFTGTEIKSFADAKKEVELKLSKANGELQELASLSERSFDLNPDSVDDIKALLRPAPTDASAIENGELLAAAIQSWQAILRTESFFQKILSFLPGQKRRRANQVRSFLSGFEGLTISDQTPYSEVESALVIEQGKLKQILIKVQGRQEQAKELFNSWCEKTAPFAAKGDKYANSILELDKRLDISLRSYMFWLAVHYFEAQWIEAMATEGIWSPNESVQRRIKYNDSYKLAYFSMLTPCLVSTFHGLPKHLRKYAGKDGDIKLYESLFNYADLLIVDEAGQVVPEVSAVSFSLAKKALVVGDVFQIEPVWSVPAVVDRQNVENYLFEDKLNDEQWELFNDSGLAANSGNLMSMAQRATRFTKESMSAPGLWLLEHRRCVDPIIQYCNDLCYSNKLEMLRKEDPVLRRALKLPALGWAQVSGKSEVKGTSRINEYEASAVANWVQENKTRLESLYKKDIQDIVAVVTPFKAQAAVISAELRKFKLGQITCGTVHSLQGAERNIVIFSTVYTVHDELSRYFFNRGANMLNVAVSRAKDSFLLFGDVSILNREPNSPGNLLGQYLFFDPANELAINAQWVKRKDLISSDDVNSARVIKTLEEHRAELRDVFSKASRELVIVSPWIAANAIEADNILSLVRQARANGITCKVMYDKAKTQNTGDGAKKERDAVAINALVESGAELIALKNVHTKNLFVDDNYMVSGSFNWLSAVRDNSRYEQLDSSICYHSMAVKEEKEVLIKNLLNSRV